MPLTSDVDDGGIGGEATPITELATFNEDSFKKNNANRWEQLTANAADMELDGGSTNDRTLKQSDDEEDFQASQKLEVAFDDAVKELQHMVSREISQYDPEGIRKAVDQKLSSIGGTLTADIVEMGEKYSRCNKWQFFTDTKQGVPWYIIYPTNFWKGIWDILLLLLIVFYVLLFLPFRIAFIKDDDALFGVDITVDFLFCADIVLTFFVAYETMSGELIFDLGLIAKNYVFSWIFPIDVISAFPFYLVSSGNSSVSNLLKGGKMVRLIKAIRILKCAKNTEYLKHTNQSFFIFSYMKYVNRMGFLFLFIVLSVHILACLWFAVGDSNFEAGHSSWMDQVGDLVTPWQKSDTEKWYLLCVYFEFVTLSSVGYGDFHPANDEERLLNIVTITIGAVVFACITGIATTYMVEAIHKNAEVFENMMILQKFMKHHNIPTFLAKPVAMAMEEQWKVSTNQRAKTLEFERLYKNVPERVMSMLTIQILAPLLGDNQEVNHTFYTVENNDIEDDDMDGFDLIRQLSWLLRQRTYYQSQHIHTEDDFSERFGIVAKGKLSAVLLNHPDKTLFDINRADFYGHEPNFLPTHAKYPWTLVAMEQTEVYEMDITRLGDVFHRYPAFEEALKENSKARLKAFKKAVKELPNDHVENVFDRASRYSSIEVIDRDKNTISALATHDLSRGESLATSPKILNSLVTQMTALSEEFKEIKRHLSAAYK